MQGDTIDINLPYLDYGYRIAFFGDQIEEIESFELKSANASCRWTMLLYSRPTCI
ncbi:MAG: hypothetical protein WDM78_15445 [Puia sp.]